MENNLRRYIIGALSIALAVAVFWYFGTIVGYVLVAGVLAIMFQPLVDKLDAIKIGRRTVPRSVASIVGLLAIWCCVLLFFVLFIPLITSKVGDLASFDYRGLLMSLQEPVERVNVFLDKYFGLDVSPEALGAMFQEQVGRLLNFDAINSVVSSVFSVAGSIAVAAVSITFIAFYFFNERGLFQRMLRAVVPTRYEDNISRAVDKISSMLSRYFRGVVFQMLIMMTVISVVLMCFGFKPQDALFVGVVEGVFNIIPYVGPWVGFIVSGLAGLTFVTSSGLGVGWVLVIIAGTVMLAQFVDNYFVSPKVFSKQMNAHPLEIFLVTLAAGSFSGVLGMLVAIPAYTVLRILAKEFLYNYKLVRTLTSKMD